MSKFNIKDFFKKNWVHFFAIGLFLIITFIYFAPQFNGYSLEQHDSVQFRGMSHETGEFRKEFGEEPLWTNSMFGGMPTTQISQVYEGNLVNKITKYLSFGIGNPAGVFLLYFIGFYIMLLCFKVNKWVAIFGSIAFALSTYFIIILQAGHVSKGVAIALAPPVIGAFYLTFRHSLKWGLLLSALFMSLEIGANHLQITYYLGIALLFLGFSEVLRLVKKNISFKQFGLATAALIVAYLFAVGLNYGNISMTNDYAKHTIRGANDIKINPDGTSSSKNLTTGLDKDYVTQWSNGISETMTLISPYIKGGGSSAIANSPFKDELKNKKFRKSASKIASNNLYWGDQPIVSGPVYIGAFVIFLALMGLIYLKDPIKWGLFGATVLCILLSWGKNYMGLTEFFLDYIPGYNKFRAVTIILSIVELLIPLLGVLFLDKLIKRREEIKNQTKPLFIGTASLIGVLVLFWVSTSSFLSTQENDYLSNYGDNIKQQLLAANPAQIKEQYKIDINDKNQLNAFIEANIKPAEEQFEQVEDFRSTIFTNSIFRSIIFILIAAALVFAFLKTTIKTELFMSAFIVLILVDLVPVNLNYLSSTKGETRGKKYKYWTEDIEKAFPLAPNTADEQVYQLETAKNPELKSKIELKVKDFAKKYDSEYKIDRKDKKSAGYKNMLAAKRFATLNLNSNYRVFESSGGFNSSRASYFHKSLGGYHGAKLRSIQNVFDFHLTNNNYRIFDMLNVKYLFNKDQAQVNPNACGNAWFIQSVKTVDTPESEIRNLGTEGKISSAQNLIVNGKKETEALIYGAEKVALVVNSDTIPLNIKTALQAKTNSVFVIDVNNNTNWIPRSTIEKDSSNSFRELATVEITHDFKPKTEAIVETGAIKNQSFNANGSIKMVEYRPNYLSYEVNTKDNQFAVFSEIYYPEGWKAFIDGKETPIIKTDYMLRGLEIPAGAKKVEMKFDLPKYKTVNTIALVMSLLLLLSFVGAIFLEYKNQKKVAS